MTLKKHAIELLMILAGFAGCGVAAAQSSALDFVSSPQELVTKYPSGSIQSPEIADKALREVDQIRAGVESKFAEEQHVCYSKFLATSCLDAAKEKRRVELQQIRKVEVEANAFNRSARVVQRDRDLAEKNARQATNPPKPLADLPVKQTGDAAGDHDDAENQRIIAEHERKMQEKQKEIAAGAQQRADNVEAHKKRVADAQARQRDVAAKKAEKQRQADEKAQKAKDVADAKAAKAAKASGATSITPPAAGGASASATKP